MSGPFRRQLSVAAVLFSAFLVVWPSQASAAGETHPVCHDNGDGSYTLDSTPLRDDLFNGASGTLGGSSTHLSDANDIIPPFLRSGGQLSSSRNWNRSAPSFDANGIPQLVQADCAAPSVPSPIVSTGDCEVSRVDGATDGMVLRGEADNDFQPGFVYFEWGEVDDLSDFVSGANDSVGLFIDDVEETSLLVSPAGVNSAALNSGGSVSVATSEIQVASGQRIYFRLVFESDTGDFTRGDIESCRRATSSGGGGSRSTTPPTTAAPETTAPPLSGPPADASAPIDDPRGFEDTGSNDITTKVSLASRPSSAGPGQGGSITIDSGGDLPPVEVTACTVNDPGFECRIENAGADYDDPATWQSGGFGDECWKEQPGGFSYSLPDPPQPPSGASASSYTVAVVKSASVEPRPSGWRSTTKFGDPAASSAVWADANGNGTYDPGVDGDTEIAQIVLCAAVAGSSGLAVAEGETTTTAPGDSEVIEVVIAPIPGAEPAEGEAELSVGLSVGTDEEFLLVTLDLTDFVFKNAAPETVPTTVVVPQLPVTGSGSGRATQWGFAILVLGAGLFVLRRRVNNC